MRKLICAVAASIIFLIPKLNAQLLTVSPAFPADTSTVSIIVDCSKGNQGLLNYSPTTDVYVHVGVITSLSSSSSDWKYVPFTWATTNPAANATYLGNNKYKFTINNIRSFFGVPAGETILKIAILFRNGTGSQKQANTDGTDMYVNVYNSSFATQFVLPPFQPKYNPVPEPIQVSVGNTLPIKYLSNQTALLKLYFNGTLVNTVNASDSLLYNLNISNPGNQQIIASANNGTITKSDTINFYVGGATNFAPLPSGAKEGLNYLTGDTSVLLVLFAPHKNKIVVVGDFNNWAQSTSYQMNETPDSNYFWIQINGLSKGVEYAYQYVIDGSLILADYNTEKVLDKNVDPSINASTYPNLKSFPAQASGTLASIIQTGKPVYNWQVTNFQRPANSNLRIYELLVRDFLAAGNWQTLVDSISYLKKLGVNAIELMPFNNFEGASSWGYNPNFYFAPDKVYGTETALKQFIDACHQQGIAVIMDMVLNHSFGSSPMVQMYWDGQNNVPATNNPWFTPYYTHDYSVGYQFNNSSPATQNFRERVIAYWLNNYHIDGYRFDLATGFTKINSCNATGGSCNDGLWASYDTTRINIWNTLYAAQQAASPGSYCILEMFSNNTERAVYANSGMMVWNNMAYNYQQSTMGYNTGWDLSGSTAANLGVAQQGIINYQESHDEERLQFKNEQYGNSTASYNIKDTATGLKRNEMAAAFWAMIPGPKMLWQFGELGYDYSINNCVDGSINNNCRLDPKPVRWDYLQDARRKHLHDVYASLFKLCDSFPSLAISTSTSYSLANAFRSLQVAGTNINVTVVGNFDVVASAGSILFQHTGTWYNYLGTDSITATGASQSITLDPGAYKVYIDKNLNDTSKGGSVVPPVDTSTVKNLQINPNPVVSGSSTIKYSLPAASDVSLSIFNITGQRLFNIDLGTQTIGTYSTTFNELPFNIYSLKNAVYILKLYSSSKTMQTAFLVLH